MVVKLQTVEGTPVRIEFPPGMMPLLIAALSVIVAFVGWMSVTVVENQRNLTQHEQRLNYIEETRFTAEDFSYGMRDFVSVREFDAVIQRLDRMEVKLDRALEAR